MSQYSKRAGVLPQEEVLAQQRAASLAARQVDAQMQVRTQVTSAACWPSRCSITAGQLRMSCLPGCAVRMYAGYPGAARGAAEQ